MHDSPLSRRHFLGVAGVAVWFAAAPRDLLRRIDETPADTAQKYKVLTAQQAATLDAFAAQIIPSEPGSPGAREANVTRFVDNGLASFAKEQRPEFEKALATLNASAPGFASLSPARQMAAMRTLQNENRTAFEILRAPVIAGMFANPSYGGNTGKAGWKLLGFEDRFFWQEPFGYYDQPTKANRRD